ncbi:hypothetical protein PoMZ_05900 [Pyricularia oryzae]|uniref:Uncharacterized protein n=1 Tax=Pyricularia oryzae TaxID=318829 RepID=A0A4P7NR21_PYROR|nr:hypothetical protein PoMZ_05900 [Pyricularia oryzae]
MELITAWQESQTDRHSRPPVTVDALDARLYDCWPSTSLFADPAPGDSEWDPYFEGEDDDRERKRNRLRCWYGSERPATRPVLVVRAGGGRVVSFWDHVNAVNAWLIGLEGDISAAKCQVDGDCGRVVVGIDDVIYIWPVDVAKIQLIWDLERLGRQ